MRSLLHIISLCISVIKPLLPIITHYYRQTISFTESSIEAGILLCGNGAHSAIRVSLALVCTRLNLVLLLQAPSSVIPYHYPISLPLTQLSISTAVSLGARAQKSLLRDGAQVDGVALFHTHYVLRLHRGSSCFQRLHSIAWWLLICILRDCLVGR